MGNKTNHSLLLWIISLAGAPVVAVLVYGVYANASRLFRYDTAYFSKPYQEKYDAPSKVGSAQEKALQQGDEDLYAELVGLKRPPRDLQPQPDLHFSILLDVDDSGYYHYLFFDFGTYRRSIHYLKEVEGRWVAAPKDPYFYWDSNQWWDFMLPPSLAYWAALIVFSLAYAVHQGASSYRRKTLGL